MTVTHQRLIKSIQVKAAAMPKAERIEALTELCLIRSSYDNAETRGFTLELALRDLWDRMNETKEKEIAA